MTQRRRRIEETFARTRDEGRAAFIAFLMAGDPDLETSELLVEAAVAGGADIVELGVPFSDPIADGPTNQAAAMRALASGTSLADVLSLARNVRRRVAETPLVLFSYFNPIHAFGIERFARRAAAAQIDGVLCVDLPPEEGTELRIALDRHRNRQRLPARPDESAGSNRSHRRRLERLRLLRLTGRGDRRADEAHGQPAARGAGGPVAGESADRRGLWDFESRTRRGGGRLGRRRGGRECLGSDGRGRPTG